MRSAPRTPVPAPDSRGLMPVRLSGPAVRWRIRPGGLGIPPRFLHPLGRIVAIPGHPPVSARPSARTSSPISRRPCRSALAQTAGSSGPLRPEYDDPIPSAGPARAARPRPARHGLGASDDACRESHGRRAASCGLCAMRARCARRSGCCADAARRRERRPREARRAADREPVVLKRRQVVIAAPPRDSPHALAAAPADNVPRQNLDSDSRICWYSRAAAPGSLDSRCAGREELALQQRSLFLRHRRRQRRPARLIIGFIGRGNDQYRHGADLFAVGRESPRGGSQSRADLRRPRPGCTGEGRSAGDGRPRAVAHPGGSC